MHRNPYIISYERRRLKLLTYQDWLAADDKPSFITKAIDEYKTSDTYNRAKTAKTYTEGENEGINSRVSWAQKVGIEGLAFNRIGNGQYPKMVRHWVFYTLGNGLNIEKEKKASLGRDFDFRFLVEGVMPAADAGVCYAFWSAGSKGVGRLVYFDAMQAFPLVDERTNDIHVLIRFWQIDTDKPLCVEIFEIDGIAEYQQQENKGLVALGPKKPYRAKVMEYPTGEEEVVDTDNYPAIPIFPLYVNVNRKSELTKNLKAVLDAYDYIASDGVDSVLRDEGIYNYLKNYGGEDLIGFLKVLQTKILPEQPDKEVGHRTESVEAPFQGKQMWLDLLEKVANSMFSMPDSITNRSVTATEIKDANKYLDTKADVLEWRACQFVGRVLDFLGVEYVDDDLQFKRRSITNDSETIENISKMVSDGYIDEETALNLNPLIADDEVPNILKRLDVGRQVEASEAFPLMDGSEPTTIERLE